MHVQDLLYKNLINYSIYIHCLQGAQMELSIYIIYNINSNVQLITKSIRENDVQLRGSKGPKVFYSYYR